MNFFPIFFGFKLLSGNFLIAIEHPEFGIYLLFNNIIFKFLSFIHQLFFSLELTTSVHESSLFASKIVCFHFEFPSTSLVTELLLLLCPLSLESFKLNMHLSSNLLWSFQILHKFLFIQLIFRCEHYRQLLTPFIEIRNLSRP